MLNKQNGFISGSVLPYALLVLALLGLLFSWNTTKSRDAEIAELTKSKDAEIAGLTSQVDKGGQDLAQLQAGFDELQAGKTMLETETVPGLKKDLSFARAANQRAGHVKDTRDNLLVQLQNTHASTEHLRSQASMVPELKRDLSFANAASQRARHTEAARDRLMSQLHEVTAANNAANEESSAMLKEIPQLRRQLSFANAANQRAVHVGNARDNLMVRLKATAADNVMLNDKISSLSASQGTENTQVAVLSDDMMALKKRLSLARAENQRAQHVKSARDKLMEQLQSVAAEKEALSDQVAIIPELKRNLSMANASNARLAHVDEARSRLMQQISSLKSNVVNAVNQ